MTDCEICGNSNANKKAEIDRVILNVCDQCASFGKKVIEPVKIRKVVTRDLPESSQYIDPDFPKIIRSAREKANINRKHLASEIGEKESVIAKIETGKLMPTLDLARSLEKFLGIELIFEYEKKSYGGGSQSKSLTIGDVVDIES